MQSKGLERLEFEIIGTQNPVSINLNTIGKIMSIELESFDYVPASTSGNSYIGVNINGIKGRWNKFGNGIQTLRTIPYKDNRYHIKPNGNGNEIVAFGPNTSNLTVSFIDRNADDSNISPSLVNFSNNYLFTFSLFVERN